MLRYISALHRAVLHILKLDSFGPVQSDVYCITTVWVITCGGIIDGDRMLALAISNWLRI